LAQCHASADETYRGSDLADVVANEEKQRAIILCAIKDSVHPEVTAAELAAALGPLSGVHRLSAIRCLEPRLAGNLGGNDLEQLVGEGLPQREAMLCSVKEQVRFGIAAQELAVALGQLRRAQRLSAIRCLEPRIGFDLGGDDIKLIVGDGTLLVESMICSISGHFREDISANEITSALGQLHEYDRLAAVRCIEKNRELRQQKIPAAFWGTCMPQGIINVFFCDHLYFSRDGKRKWSVPVACPPRGSGSLEAVYLGTACRMHDACYSEPGARKSQCDAALRSLLEDTCDQTLAGEEWLKARTTCRESAREAHTIVSNRGCMFYRRAQRRAGVDNAVCD
jgi:hypothetical protein